MMRFFEVDLTRRPKKPHQIITLSFSEVLFQVEVQAKYIKFCEQFNDV